MTKEEDIRREIKAVKKPATKTYAAVFLVVVALLALYLLLSYGFLELNLGTAITSPDQAQSAASNVGKGVNDISTELDAISNILGS